MTTKYITDNQETTLEIAGSGNTWIINKTAIIDGPATGIHEAAARHDNRIVVKGEVYGPGYSNSAIESQGDDVTIEVAKSGKLSGHFAITAFGDNALIVNHGHILSTNTAVGLGGNNGHFINYGTINAGHYAFEGDQVEKQTFENAGMIITESGLTFEAKDLVVLFDKGSVVESEDVVLRSHSDTDATAHITNKGTLTAVSNGFATAIDSGDGREILRNSGTISGDVELGGGNDRYDGRGGEILNGVVVGEAGNDTYILTDKNTKVFDGLDGGHDKLVVSFSTTLEANNEIEEIKLGGTGNFNLHASDTANDILGNSGNNKLFGMGGNDTLTGGKGTDFLTGGEGADVFNFKPHLDREIVTDFVDGVDHLGFFAGKEVTSINDLIKHHAEDVNGDLVISGDGTEMIIRGMHKADLSMADFMS
jgi:Ca2+-binding RTX toxin-like protein